MIVFGSVLVLPLILIIDVIPFQVFPALILYQFFSSLLNFVIYVQPKACVLLNFIFVHFFYGKYLSITIFKNVSKELKNKLGSFLSIDIIFGQTISCKLRIKFSLLKFLLPLLYTWILGNLWVSGFVKNWTRWSDTEMVKLPDTPSK